MICRRPFDQDDQHVVDRPPLRFGEGYEPGVVFVGEPQVDRCTPLVYSHHDPGGEHWRHCSGDNRTTQAVFRCVRCGHEAHADVVGATNVLRAGLALHAAQAA